MNFIEKLTYVNFEFTENEWLLEQKFKSLIISLYLIISVLSIFMLIRFITDEITTAVAELIAIIIFFTLVKFLKESKDHYDFISTILILIATLLIIIGIFSSGYEPIRGIWLLPIIVLAYYLRDKREGLIWTTIHILILLLSMYLHPNPTIKSYLVIIFSLLSASILLYLYDNIKAKEQEIILKQKNLLQNIIDTVPVRIFWKDKNLKYLGCNKLFAKDANLADEHDLIGKDDYDMVWSDEADLYRNDDKSVMESAKAKLDIEEPQTHADGTQLWLSTSKIPLKDNNGEIYGVLGTYFDITQRKESEEAIQLYTKELQYLAHHDTLTGLPNRVLFNDRLNQAIEKAKRNNSKIALLFIDLDHFKEINDSLGHDVGDEILKEVAKRLKSAKRDKDTLARLGGDEFTIILEDLNQTLDASTVSTKILDVLAKPIDIDDNILYVSSSIGISIYPDDGLLAQSLFKFSDSAMYKAKKEGRNNFQYYSADMTEQAFERVVMETSLRMGLKNEEFVVYYQPQVNGKTNKIIGMEALVRWQHPTMGLVSPAKFIPLAESTGLIVELDRFVMKAAMTQIAQWYSQGLNPGVLAMNLAVKQLQKEDFISMFKKLMEETNCKAEWLAFEVTEGQIMTHPEEAIVILQKISELGIELAVDDFGTGYSSLAYLKKLPIDKLKIDQAFIRDLPGDEEDEAITKAVIALAKSLNLKVIAEGVETKEQRDFIVLNGCENIQGYFYSKPVPAVEFEKLLLLDDKTLI